MAYIIGGIIMVLLLAWFILAEAKSEPEVIPMAPPPIIPCPPAHGIHCRCTWR